MISDRDTEEGSPVEYSHGIYIPVFPLRGRIKHINHTMSNPGIRVPIAGDKPADPVLVDDVQDEKVVPEEVLLRSKFADLSKVQILRKFWRLALTGVAVSFGGMYAGYCISAAGNIVANPGMSASSLADVADRSGFINQFGTIRAANGTLSLDALHVSLWSGEFPQGEKRLKMRFRVCSADRIPGHIAFHL